MKWTSSVTHVLRDAAGNPVKALFLGLIRFYQVVISPGLPSRCKYYPSCSQYALDAVREYGAFKGFVLAGWRILRCNPLSYGGYDPVSRQRLFKGHSCSDPSHEHGCEPEQPTGLGATRQGASGVAGAARHSLVRG